MAIEVYRPSNVANVSDLQSLARIIQEELNTISRVLDRLTTGDLIPIRMIPYGSNPMLVYQDGSISEFTSGEGLYFRKSDGLFYKVTVASVAEGAVSNGLRPPE